MQYKDYYTSPKFRFYLPLLKLWLLHPIRREDCFFLQHSEDTNEKEIDRLKTAINIRETTNRFGAVVFALPTPLDIFYGTYRGIRALRKYFSAREEVPETRYNC